MEDNSSENANQQQDNEWRQRELGALWVRQGKSQRYLTGTIRVGEFGVEKEVKIIVFSNKHKSKNERAPDYVVYESKDKEEGQPVVAEKEETTSVDLKEEEIPEVFQ
jgi:hypothetical protein